jgi:hypothetical protein
MCKYYVLTKYTINKVAKRWKHKIESWKRNGFNFVLEHWYKNFAAPFYQTTRSHILKEISLPVHRSEELSFTQSHYVHLLQFKKLCMQIDTPTEVRQMVHEPCTSQ